ncbi:MAG: T9SS type A sorting domain-containing protein [Bacteroidales bacterium]|nr:T9SS type A sorting domain-containing protein [Bacteroidales bacterium]
MKNTTLTIHNIKGQAIIQRQVTEQQTVVDVTVSVSEFYFVKVARDDGIMVGKFVKE